MDTREKIQFFDFEFITNEFGELIECNYTNETVGFNHEIIMNKQVADSLFHIYYKYMKKVQQHKIDVEKINMYKEKIKEDEKIYHHKRNCYKKAIYEHQRACDHYRRTVRAFEQLAKCNEKAQQEIEYNKQKGGFRISDDE